ncbi:MAG TPA: type VI secretion system tip protein TssI/VgrG [Gemmataceae bacterium]|nr:type VI secretion system tip protein TssI/VgrG [Gemmataceae bacterium]
MGSATYTQAGRPLAVTTPLGPDVLLLVAFRGRETISKPFQYELDLVAPARTAIPFDQLMGRPMKVELRSRRGATRYFYGLVSRFSEGHRDANFTHYRAELVPELWLLTKRSGSRIFQHISVPEILRQVLNGLDVSYLISGAFAPRDYCAQYRESDFDFASRLMEEEGICYFFRHSERGCQLVLANTRQGHPDIPTARDVPFDPDGRIRDRDDRVTRWQKTQELRSGRCELRDHCFELPGVRLEAARSIQDDVLVGRVNHRLSAGLNGKLEWYDYPGAFAQRFDGIDRGGTECPGELPRIFEDGQRTAGIRMQQEATPGLTIEGSGSCCQFLPGHTFALTNHGPGDGPYVLTGVTHTASQPGYASEQTGDGFTYENTFTCIPFALPFRPARETPRPTVHGTQTATVVGPPGDEIFIDKYGRVKVQFRWDREGRSDVDSSCWVRVAQLWAGKEYGTFFWPRVGHEVVIAFEEGDPDRPIIIGSVYNAENITPWPEPESKDWSGIVTQSTPGASTSDYNELSFKDQKGEECIYMQAQRDFRRYIKHDDLLLVDNRQEIEIKNGRKQVITNGDDEKVVANGNVATHTKGDESHRVDGRYSTVAREASLRGGMSALSLDSNMAFLYGPSCKMCGMTEAVVQAGSSFVYVTLGSIVIRAPQVIVQSGSTTIQAAKITLDAPLVEAAGIVKCPVLVADAVSAKTYTAGAGNIL